MQLLWNRPLAISCIGFAAAVFLCYFLNAQISLWISLSLFLLALAFLVLYLVLRRRTLFLFVLCLGMACLASLSTAVFLHLRCERWEEMVGTERTVEGTVLSVRTTQYGGSELEVALWSLDSQACYDRIRVYCPVGTQASVGDSVRARVTCREFKVDDTYDARASALSEGIFGIAAVRSAEALERLPNGRFSLRGMLLSLRASLSARLSESVGGEEGALCVAFLLGDRSLLSDQVNLSFRRVGVSHLLALSGLHVSILIALLDLLLKRLGCTRHVRAVFVIVLSVFYLLLTGCSLSTVRAVSMCCVLMLSFLFRGTYDSFTALCLSLAGILLFAPWSIVDLGMWMSFLAAGSIVTFYPIFSRFSDRYGDRKGFVRLLLTLAGSVFVGVVANLALAPIQGLLFGELSLLSVPATLLLSYPMTLTLILSALSLILVPLSPICKAVAGLILEGTERLSRSEGILLPMEDACSYVLLILLSVTLILLALLKFKRPFLVGLVPLALWGLLIPSSLLVTHLSYSRTTAEYVSEASAGEALVLAREGKCIVADLSASGADVSYEIAEAVRDARATEIGDVILASYASDDRKMLAELFSKFLVRRLHLPTARSETEASIRAELVVLADAYGIEVQEDTQELCLSEITDVQSVAEHREGETEPAVLFTLLCGEERLSYANGVFSVSVGAVPAFREILEDTEIMIHGGERRGEGRFFAGFEDLHTLILQSPQHTEGFSPKLLARVSVSEQKKYVFD